MSEADSREWRFYLDDMLIFCGKVIAYTEGLDRLIHGYLGIDNDTLWSIIRGDIPELLRDLRAMKAQSK